jgi:peptidoglycan/LPS O-acetylase OafA/YrhL
MTIPHSSLTHPKYRADIDGLRAIAVLSVVAFHAFPEWVKGGFIGVDVFFVISGFLISTIIFGSLEKGTFSFSDFYARRIKRIFPALVLVLIASYVFGWFTLFTDEYQRLGKHIAAGALFLSNIQLWKEAGYFDASADTKPLLHLWSLGIEEQFYIVWPLLLWFAWKRKFNFLVITVIVAVASFYLNVQNVHKDAVAAFYSPFTRFWELLCGSSLAWLTLYRQEAFASIKIRVDTWLNALFKGEQPGQVLPGLLSVCGLVLLVYGFWRINKEVDFPGTWAVVPVLSAVLLISAGPKAWLNRVILSNRFAVWFGLISFPLYLWHWPLLAFARIVEGQEPSGEIRVAVVLLSIVLAWMTYKLVETPLRFGQNDKRKLVTLLVFMTSVGIAGYETYERDGMSFRMALKEHSQLQELIKDPLPKVNDLECAGLIPELQGLEFDGGCKLSKHAAPTILFLGDSHTAQYRNAVWKSFPSETVLMLVQTSCLPFSGDHFLHRDGCEEKYHAVLQYLERNSSIKTVVLSGYWSYLMSGGMVKKGNNWRSAKPLTEEGASSFKANGTKLISTLVRSGKEIVFMKDLPDLNFDIQSCVDVPPPLRKILMPVSAGDCVMNSVQFAERLAPYDEVIADMLKPFPSVRIYDPRPLFCKEGQCRGSDGTLPYYFNGDHVNRYGADMVVGRMKRALESGASHPPLESESQKGRL